MNHYSNDIFAAITKERPTAKQLALLSDLCEHLNREYIVPETKDEASKKIDSCLKAIKKERKKIDAFFDSLIPDYLWEIRYHYWGDS